MNILAIGAHYDDLELGCSGTLIKHVDAGDKVIMIVVSDSAYKDPEGKYIRSTEAALLEGKNAAKIIGAELVCLNYKTFMIPLNEEITRHIMYYIEKFNIDTVYTHWIHDIHRDHQNTSKASMMAGRHVQRFFMYRSNFYDTEQAFRGAYYSDITNQIEKKIEVIKAHKSELERVRYKWLDFFLKQNANDGQKIGVEYAERFDIIRYLA